MLLYCLLLGLVVITQPVIFKTFNINSTRHLLLDFPLFASRIWNRCCASNSCICGNICYLTCVSESDRRTTTTAAFLTAFYTYIFSKSYCYGEYYYPTRSSGTTS